MVKILDLYCGMGGLSLGFLLAMKNARIVGLDKDPDAVRTFNFNLRSRGGEAHQTDLLKARISEKFDIIIGGPPCQPFSIANSRRRGKEHPLYPTFPRFFDIVIEKRPMAFLLENVKGLLTKAHKHIFDEQIRKVKSEYMIKYAVLNAAYFGVPQKRERLFVLGIRKDLGVKPSFPRPTHAESTCITLNGKLHKWVTVRDAIRDLLAVPPLCGDHKTVPLTQKQLIQIIKERNDTSRHFGKMVFPDPIDEPSRVISSHTIEGSKRETIIIPTEHVITGTRNCWESEWGKREISLNKPSYTITEKHRSGQMISITDHEFLDSIAQFSETSMNKHRPQDILKPSTTIRATFGKAPPDAFVCVNGKLMRRLTVRECLRLQSFPDWWRFPDGVSLTKKFKLVGEAVPPILAYKIAIHIAHLLKIPTREPPKPEEFVLPYFEKAFAEYF